MFKFWVVLQSDALDWRVVEETPEQAITELNVWAGRAGLESYELWPSEGKRTITLSGFVESTDDPDVLLARLREALRPQPFGRVATIRVIDLTERADEERTDDVDIVENRLEIISHDIRRMSSDERAEAGDVAAFGAPSRRCPGCGAPRLPHLPGCPWSQ